jgi:hypothetical protein
MDMIRTLLALATLPTLCKAHWVPVTAPNTLVDGASFAGNVHLFEQQGDAWVQRGSANKGDGSIIKFCGSLCEGIVADCACVHAL